MINGGYLSYIKHFNGPRHTSHLVNSLFPEIHLWRQSLMHELCWMFLHQVWINVSQQWMLCSEWVPSEWESDKNITIIHSTPVHQLTSGENQPVFSTRPVRLRVCKKKSTIKTPKEERNLHKSSSIYKAKTVLKIYLYNQFLFWFRQDGFFWRCGLLVDYCDVFIRLSFWRHPFTAEHPLLRHWCNATFLQTIPLSQICDVLPHRSSLHKHISWSKTCNYVCHINFIYSIYCIYEVWLLLAVTCSTRKVMQMRRN